MSKRIFVFAAACLAGPALAASTTAMAQPASFPFTARVQSLCAGMGLNPTEAGFVYCVISLKETAALAVATGAPIGWPRYLRHRVPRGSFVRPYPPVSWSGRFHSFGAWGFFRSPGHEQHAREAGACAGLGLPTESFIFSQCVADLDLTLFRVNLVGSD